MKFDGVKTEEPFACSPKDQTKFCALYYNIHEDDATGSYLKAGTRLFAKNQCRCALNGKIGDGYCSSILGSNHYRRAVGAM